MIIEINEKERDLLINTIRTLEYVPGSKFGDYAREIQISLLTKLGHDINDIKTHDDVMKEKYPLSFKNVSKKYTPSKSEDSFKESE